MRKITSLMLVCILLVSIFSACNTAADTSDQQPAASDASQAQPAESGDGESSSQPADSGERYTISWTGYQMAPIGNNAPVLEYFEDYFNVNFDVWNIDHQQYEELLNVRLASGEIPDMFMVRQTNDLQKYVQQDLLAPIPMEKIEQFMPNTLAYSYTEVSPGALDFGKVDGEIYGLPAMNMGNMFRLPIVYNQDWLEAVGREVPTTIEEFEDVIYAFANEDPDGNGVKDTYGLSEEGLNLLWGMYGMVPRQDYFSVKDGKIVYMPIEPEMKEALAYANKWYNDGVLDPEFITGENTGGYWAVSHSYINGRIGMTVIGNYYHWTYEGDYFDYVDEQEVPNEPGAVMKELQALQPGARRVFGQPLINTDGTQGGIRGYNYLMRFYGIGADAAEDEGKFNKILEIYEAASDAQPDDTLKQTFRYGFEDEHWVWAERDREIIRQLSPYLEDPNSRYEYGAILWWTSGDPPKDRTAEWGLANGFDKGGIYSDMPISTEAMARYDAQLETLRQQAYIQIITGDRPLDYFDEFVEEYLRQGGQEILDEANAWYVSSQQ